MTCTIALLSIGLVACGKTSGHVGVSRAASAKGSSKIAAVSQSEPPRSGDYDGDDHVGTLSDSDADDSSKPSDGDGDSDNPTGSYYDSDDSSVRGFGHPADLVDRREVTALIHRFYDAARTRDGQRGCALLTPAFVRLAAEFYDRRTRGSRSGSRDACRQTMTETFTRNASQYAYAAELPIASVKVKGTEGLVVLASRKLPAVRVVREHGNWKMGAFFDRELP